MRHLNFYLILLVSLVVFQTSCKKSKSANKDSTQTERKLSFHLLGIEEAKEAITTDVSENYFEGVRSLEMSIILKQEEAGKSRSKLLGEYKEALRNEVMEFTEDDIALIREAEDSLNVLLKDVKDDWLVKDINLVKIDASSYGEGVWYTRDAGIFIPIDQLMPIAKEGLISVLLHEIFHIMSRYNEDFRRSSYDLIGFKPVEGELVFPEDLDKRVLLNPDGVDMRYAIQLNHPSEEGNQVSVIPVIHSNSAEFKAEKDRFFGYIQFDLFGFDEQNGRNIVQSGGEEGGVVVPAVPDEYYLSFFDQIKDNTQYIIHPDEIMADNFMFAIFAHNNSQKFDFSPEGSDLLDRFKKLIFIDSE